jgi:DNA-binding NarL/FixJ family response regulator
MSGLRFLERLRDESSPKILQNFPVVIVTGETDIRLFQRMSHLKISGFLRKPINETALLAAIEKALRWEVIPPAVLKGRLESSSEADAASDTNPSIDTGQEEYAAGPVEIEEESEAEDEPKETGQGVDI